MLCIKWDFPGDSHSEESGGSAGDSGLIPGSRRCPGEGNGYPLQYPGLESYVDRRPWWATVHGVTKEAYRTERLTLSLSKQAYTTLNICGTVYTGRENKA